VASLTGADLGSTTTTPSAALFLRIDEVHYALAFGQGWPYLRQGKSIVSSDWMSRCA
jgi:hypothetical protein